MPSWKRTTGGGNHRSNTTAISKTVSYLLRHGAEKAGLPLDDAGFATFDNLTRQKTLRGLTLPQLHALVANDSKMRYTMKQEGGTWMVRANQGHSMKSVNSSALLTKITANQIGDFPIIAHGTYNKSWDLIRSSGLNKMTRNHIHFSPGHPGDPGVYSGRADSAQLVIEIDLPVCLAAGIEFFISDNRVVLSPGPIPPQFFKQVYKIKSREVIFRGADIVTTTATVTATATGGGAECGGGGGGGGGSDGNELVKETSELVLEVGARGNQSLAPHLPTQLGMLVTPTT
ncbi:MAG TPA: RNA 2'-phosphotransferase, partial [Myxococcales bacterium]|nr:RNA 2'-phosphotransferase [Myxococcales bacterium]